MPTVSEVIVWVHPKDLFPPPGYTSAHIIWLGEILKGSSCCQTENKTFLSPYQVRRYKVVCVTG